MEKETKYIYFRESALQSFVADVWMFITICAAMAVNHFYLGDQWFWATVLFVFFLIGSVGRVKRRQETFTSKEELKKYINETL